MRSSSHPIHEVVEFSGGSAALFVGQLEAVPLSEGGVRPIRLPRANWSHFPPGAGFLTAAVSAASGVRIVIETEASMVRLRVRCSQLVVGETPGQANHFVATLEGVRVASAAPGFSDDAKQGAWKVSAPLSSTGNQAYSEFAGATVTVDNGQSQTSASGGAAQTYSRRSVYLSCGWTNPGCPNNTAPLCSKQQCTTVLHLDQLVT